MSEVQQSSPRYVAVKSKQSGQRAVLDTIGNRIALFHDRAHSAMAKLNRGVDPGFSWLPASEFN